MEAAIMTVSELALYLRVTRSTVYRLLKAADLPAFRVGSDWRFMRKDVEEWMLSRIKTNSGSV